MTYLRHGVEYFEPDERACYDAIQALMSARRTANTSQIARVTGLSRNRVDRAMTHLYNRSYVRDAYRGAAHHWRPTNKIAPSAEPAPCAIKVTRHESPPSVARHDGPPLSAPCEAASHA